MVVAEDWITEETNVDELLTRYPSAAPVFIRRRMGCVGCGMARFESLAEVCAAYAIPLEVFLAEIRLAVGKSP